MSKFGWSYPPGAANDPNAPYNQPDYNVDMLKDKSVVARKDHKCEFCGQPIKKGDRYRYMVFVDNETEKSRLFVSHQHLVCPYEEEWP